MACIVIPPYAPLFPFKPFHLSNLLQHKNRVVGGEDGANANRASLSVLGQGNAAARHSIGMFDSETTTRPQIEIAGQTRPSISQLVTHSASVSSRSRLKSEAFKCKAQPHHTSNHLNLKLLLFLDYTPASCIK